MRLTSKFDTSNTKKRMTMLSRQINSQKIWAKKITLLPVLTLLFCFFAVEANAQDISEVTIEDLVQELSERLSDKTEFSESDQAALSLLAKSILEKYDSEYSEESSRSDLENLQEELEKLVMNYNNLVQEYLTKARSGARLSQSSLEEIYEKIIAANKSLTKVANEIDTLQGGLGQLPAPPYPPKPSDFIDKQ